MYVDEGGAATGFVVVDASCKMQQEGNEADCRIFKTRAYKTRYYGRTGNTRQEKRKQDVDDVDDDDDDDDDI
ncbi:hypothetical protein PV326_010788 [Microctonus aethiopoides]|nr:hypothetical protein PV326_010788 [Microctonus aethiopoides]